MKLPRIIIEPDRIDKDEISFSLEQSRRLCSVLRLKIGDQALVSTGSKDYLVMVTLSDKKNARGRILSATEVVLSDSRFVLAFGCVRPDPMEQIFRHCTELGVTDFAPLTCVRSMRRPVTPKQRWNAIVESAAAQSHRSPAPRIFPPMRVEEFLALDIPASCKLLLSPAGAPILAGLKTADLTSVAAMAGPEGGFDDREIAAAEAAGYSPVSLGTEAILRTETAAVAVCALVMAHRALDGSAPLNPGEL